MTVAMAPREAFVEAQAHAPSWKIHFSKKVAGLQDGDERLSAVK
jgi:hypothetical protein